MEAPVPTSTPHDVRRWRLRYVVHTPHPTGQRRDTATDAGDDVAGSFDARPSHT